MGKTSENNLEQLLQLATKEDLVIFSLEYAKKHSDFGQELQAFLGKKYLTDDKTTKEYVRQLVNAFSETKDVGSRWHSYEMQDWDSIFNEAGKVIKEGDRLLELGNADAAATIATEFFKMLCDEFNLNYLYDDEFMGGTTECEDAEELLLSAISHPNISKQLQKALVAEIMELSNDDLGDYDLIDIDDLKLQVTIKTSSNEDGLKLLDEQIRQSKGTYDEHIFVERKRDMLRELGRDHEANKVENDFISLPEIRRIVVERLVNGKKYKAAEGLVKEGIKVAIANKVPYDETRWTKRLLGIYELQGDKPHQIEVAKKLFMSERGALGYYHKLKALIPQAAWKEELAKLIEESQIAYSTFGSNNLADIYVEEGDTENLYHYIVKYSGYDTSKLDHYAQYAGDEHVQELLAMYDKLLRKLASGQADVKKYPRIAASMECMLKLKGGKEAAHDLAEFFREEYRRRPSMMNAISQF